LLLGHALGTATRRKKTTRNSKLQGEDILTYLVHIKSRQHSRIPQLQTSKI
jgi:hypothetical protein